MKNNKRIYFILFLVALFLIPMQDADARRRKRRKPLGIFYADAWGGLGYSSIFNDLKDASTPGGASGLFGAGFTFNRKWFIMSTGLEIQYLNSQSSMDSYQQTATYHYNTPDVSRDFEFNLNFPGYSDSYHTTTLNIPLTVGAQFGRYFGAIGAKYTLPMMATANSTVEWNAKATDPSLIDGLFDDMPQHGFASGTKEISNTMKLTSDVRLTAEFGVIIDEWLPKGMKQLKNKKKSKLTYRASLFCDYALTDANNNTPTKRLVTFPNEMVNPDGTITANMSDFANLQTASLMAVNQGSGVTPMNAFVVGAKLKVMLQLNKPKKKKRRRRRPRPKPRKPVPSPVFLAKVVDFESEDILDAKVSLIKLNARDTIFSNVSDKETGMVGKKMKSNKYLIHVSRPGYIDYNDTIYQIVNDTILVELQPIQKNTTVILEDLYFDVDKTSIDAERSQATLNSLYELLAANPKMKILITGHTDNTGSKRYNYRLSKGRAQAVFDDMVKRGIDPGRMKCDGMGPDDPIDTNKTKEGRANNRRVEFTIK